MRKWMKTICPKPKVVNPPLLLLGRTANDVQVSAYDEKPVENRIFAGIDLPDHGLFHLLKPKMEDIEKACPGLGALAIQVAEMAGSSTFGILSPRTSRYHAEFIWWYGETDDDAVIEMWGGFDELSEDEIAETRKRLPSQWCANLPKWVIDRGGKELKPKWVNPILEAAYRKRNPYLRDVADAILGVLNHRKGSFPGLVDCDCEQVYLGAYLRWDENDQMLQLADDVINRANENADYTTTTVSVSRIDLTLAGIQKWKAETEAGFALYTALDHLLSLVAVPMRF